MISETENLNRMEMNRILSLIQPHVKWIFREDQLSENVNICLHIISFLNNSL